MTLIPVIALVLPTPEGYPLTGQTGATAAYAACLPCCG